MALTIEQAQQLGIEWVNALDAAGVAAPEFMRSVASLVAGLVKGPDGKPIDDATAAALARQFSGAALATVKDAEAAKFRAEGARLAAEQEQLAQAAEAEAAALRKGLA